MLDAIQSLLEGNTKWILIGLGILLFLIIMAVGGFKLLEGVNIGGIFTHG